MKNLLWSIRYFQSRNKALFGVITVLFVTLVLCVVFLLFKFIKTNKKVEDSSEQFISTTEFFSDEETDIKSDAQGNIPADALNYEGHCYYFYNDMCSWSLAKEICEGKGGHLLTINSSNEQSFIDNSNNSNHRYWIGAYREDNSNNWKWITGEKWSYTNWGDGEPNDSSNVISNENRVAVWPQKWNDLNENSEEQEGYICEWDYSN